MQVLVRLSDELYRKLEEEAKRLGVSKAEVLRIAFKRYLASKKRGKETEKIRGMLRPKVSMEELERIYQVEGR